MFRKSLLVTTALVLGTSVASAATHKAPAFHPAFLNHGVPGHFVGHSFGPVALGTGKTDTKATLHNVLHTPKSGATNFSKSPNGQWISWYGYTAENISSCYTSSYYGYHYCIQDNANNAAPVTLAKKVKAGATISIPLFQEEGASVTPVIYSATASGLPGKVLSSGTITGASDNEYCCTNARSATLSKGVAAGNVFVGLECGAAPCYAGWDMEDTDFSGDASSIDYFHYTEAETYSYGTGVHSTKFSEPWFESTYYPTNGAYSIN
jgi:hypothetical protein